MAVHSLLLRLHSWGKEGEREKERREGGRKVGVLGVRREGAKIGSSKRVGGIRS